MAGGWYVSTEIPSDQRQMFLGLMYLLEMAAITCAAIFPGLLLLFVDNYRRVLTGLLLIPAFVGFLFAIFIFSTLVDCYYKFS
jgi:hypothetical protein